VRNTRGEEKGGSWARLLFAGGHTSELEKPGEEELSGSAGGGRGLLHSETLLPSKGLRKAKTLWGLHLPD